MEVKSGPMNVAYREKLIDLVKLYPGLWNQSKKARGIKHRMWDNIGAELGTTGFNARRQWEILRDQVRRENKRVKEDPYYTSKWIFYKKMQFSLLQNNNSSGSVHSDDGEQSQSDQKTIPEQNQNLVPKIEESQLVIQVRKDLQEQAVTRDASSPSQPPSVEDFNSIPMTIEPKQIVEDYYPSTSTGAGVSSSTQLSSFTNRFNDYCETTTRSQNNRYPDDCPRQRSQPPAPPQRPRTLSLEDNDDYCFAMSLVPSLKLITGPKNLRLRSKIMNLIAETLEQDYEEIHVTFSEDLREEKSNQDKKMSKQTSDKKD